MANRLNKLTITGFKSIRELRDFELRNLNVLIGGNGAGKSNFVEIFRMLRAMVDQNFGSYILTGGGCDDFLFNGPKETPSIIVHFLFGRNEYGVELRPAADERFLIMSEVQKYTDAGGWQIIRREGYESRLPEIKDEAGVIGKRGVGYYVFNSLSNWVVYHFHDTSSSAPMRRSEIVEDNKRLRSDAANIAPFLLRLKNEVKESYREITDAIRLVTPFFDDFTLESVQKGEKETVKLTWKQKGSDYPMQPYHFSDGTIRFICLATALLQPNPPSTIVIDEPELGLHPYAIDILAELIHAAAQKTQVIISTQSPALVDCFTPEDIIVVNRENGASTFRRLDSESLSAWLKDYSLGELWRKNVVAGGPVNE
ncbi:MAG: AAA family ATPase [Chlorobiales bacterium]|nr:AAA family ATPase [Chlorobiales bacterium]